MFNSSSPIPYWRLSSFYFFYFALLGAWLPFWPLYLIDLGFNTAQVGYLAGVMMATKIIAPSILGWLADNTGKRLTIIRFGSFIAFASFLLVFVKQYFWWLVWVTIAYAFFWNAVLAQFEVVTLSYLKTQHQRYSRLRLWGSIGFISAVALLGFMFDFINVRWLPSVMAVLLAGIWLSSLLVGEPPCNEEAKNAKQLPLYQTVKQPHVICFLLGCFLLQASHGPYYTFFSVYLESHGYSRTVTGLLWSLGVVAEVIVFVIMHKLLVRFSLRKIMLMSLFLTVVRWLLIAFFVDSWPVLVFAQCLHAASFGSYHAFAVEMVRRVFTGALQGQGMAIYSGLSFGGGGALGAVLSGWFWEINALITFIFAAIVAAMAIGISLLPAANHLTLDKAYEGQAANV